MRVNIYSQELTDEVKLISKSSDGTRVTGIFCLPNGSPTTKREVLPLFVQDIWDKHGRPSALYGLTNPYINIREEPIVYHAVQLVLHSSPMLHHPPMDDDRSAVTLWLPKSKSRREELAKTFEEMARLVREAPPDTGLD